MTHHARQTMDVLWSLRWLLYFGVYFVFRETTAVTFTNEQSSFLQLKKWNVLESRGLAFRFKTFRADALLLYMDDEGKSNFLRVELFQGKLRLTCSHGSRFGAMAVEIGDNLNDLVWHRILLERNKGKTMISLDSQSKSTVNSRDKTSLHIESSMYFGGLPPNLAANSVTQPSVTLLKRFVGCITDIEMFEYSAGQGRRRKAILEDSNGIVAGCTDMCQKGNTCQNNGTCMNRFSTSECDCTGTGYRGETCEEALPVLGLGQSDYVILNRSNKAVSTRHDRIIFRFKTANQNGSLLESGRGRDYMVVELYRGSILLRWNLGSGELYVHVREKACDDDKWHSVDISRNQRQFGVTLDGVLQVSRSFPGRFISFDLKEGEGDVFVGGMPKNDFFSKSRSSGISFDGCLQEIIFNGIDIVQGVFKGGDTFTTRGRPRSSCEITRDLEPTTALLTPSPPRVTTDQSTTEQTTTAVYSTKKIQFPTSYTTTPTTTRDDYAYSSQQVPTTHARSFSGNSVMPCPDDEDCDSGDLESGDNEDPSGTDPQPSGDKITPSSSGDYIKVKSTKIPKIITNHSVKKTSKVRPTKDPSFVIEDEHDGEPDIPRANCVGDDEDGCDDDDESGQTSAEIGSAGSASPTTMPPPVDTGSKLEKRSALVKKNNTKKWALIAGIIAVGTLLVAFCIFAIWWLCKHKNDPNWNGTYNGSREKCLQSEITDV